MVMMWYNNLKYLYEKGHYTNAQFAVFVKAKWITSEEYFSITGVEYA
ncbi:XkdX family protein [Staphylococcus chromogenes]